MATHSSVFAWMMKVKEEREKVGLKLNIQKMPEGNTEGPGTASSEPPLPS